MLPALNANYYNEYVGSIELYPLVHMTNPNWQSWETDGKKKKGFKGIVSDTIGDTIGAILREFNGMRLGCRAGDCSYYSWFLFI